MKTFTKPLALGLSIGLALSALPAVAAGPATTGAPATKANRIVGAWLVAGNVSGANCLPASSGPASRPATYLLFHAGGTITELPRLPSNAAQAGRTFGIGTWHYEPDTDTYFVSFRFDWYGGGLLAGYQTVEREIRLDAGGDTMAGPAVSVRYDLNGTEVYSQCGSATATRL